MRILIVNNVLQESRYRRHTRILSSQVAQRCRANVRTTYFKSIAHMDEYHDDFDAVILSGTEGLVSKARDRKQFSKLTDIIRNINMPILGICGGEQLIGLAYGKPIVPTGRLVRGYRNIEILDADPFFEGLPKVVSVMQSHYEIVESLPAGFKLLARSNTAPIEALRSSKALVYGVQFHPEFNNKQHPAGARILANFGRLAKQ